MDYLVWIFAGLLLVTLILYIISMAKNIALMEKITRVLTMPFTTATAVSLLLQRLPDSAHVMLYLSVSMLLIILSEFFSIFNDNEKLDGLSRALFIFDPFVWFLLYRTIFYIYKIPLILHIIGILIGIGIFVCIYIFSGKQNKRIYFQIGLSCLGLSLLNYTAFITLCTTFRLYSFILMAGTLTLAASYALRMFKINKPQISTTRKYAVTSMILNNTAEVLLCAAAVSMVF